MASEGELYIGGLVLCQFIEPVTFVCRAFIFALRNITLGGYLDTCRTFRTFTAQRKALNIYIYSEHLGH